MVLSLFRKILEKDREVSWAILIFVPLILLAYLAFLGRTPVHLNQDELGFSLNAYSVAKTGFDENGRFLPLYFWHLGVMWANPVIEYLTSLFLLILPLSEITIRLPSVFIGLVNIFLVYLLGKRLFASRLWGLLAAVILALTPVHFIHSRILLDNLYIVPFVLLWLIFFYDFLQTGSEERLFLSALWLGVGVHSYHAAKVMMPLYFLLSILVGWRKFQKNKRYFLILFLGFILPLLPLIPWLGQYPDTLTDQVRYTGLYDVSLGPLAGILSLLTPESLTRRALIFLAYFNPDLLFFRGDASLIHSTWKIGALLLSLIILIPLGIYQVIKKRTPFFMLILLGFLTAPLAPALVADLNRISKVLVILPFAALLATAGLQFLFSAKKIWRYIGIFLLVLMPLQFSFLLFDYFTDYRARSYDWFNYNLGGALETTIKEAQRPTGSIFLDGGTNFIDRYWKFYLIKHQKEELLAKTFYPNPSNLDLNSLPARSVLLLRFDHVDGLKTQIGPFGKIENIFEPDGTSRFYIYRN